MMQTILPAIIAAFATIIAAWLSRPKQPSASQPAVSATVVTQQLSGAAVVPVSTKVSSSLYFGIAGLLAWFLPVFGLPVALIGIGFGVLHLSELPQRRFARIGIWLNVVGLMISTANAAVGAYMGYHGMF